ncbi:MAG: hypothetical protein BZ136_09315 [Methanosphaera sp. rholeuAM74]|nr:MAG: hypothetical protein BZ136_09315 [Methanosphaera sp. rholeuAM74]
MKAFVDTNVPLSYAFSIEPHNRKAMQIFTEYVTIYWSELVHSEFNHRFDRKLDNLIIFYDELSNDLLTSETELYSINQLKKYAKNKHYTHKQKKDVLESIHMLWDINFEKQFYVDIRE